MALMIVVGIAFAVFCLIAVFLITMIAQPPNKAVDYYVQKKVKKTVVVLPEPAADTTNPPASSTDA